MSLMCRNDNKEEIIKRLLNPVMYLRFCATELRLALTSESTL